MQQAYHNLQHRKILMARGDNKKKQCHKAYQEIDNLYFLSPTLCAADIIMPEHKTYMNF